MDPLVKIPWGKTLVMNNARKLVLVIGLMMFWLSSLAHATSVIIELTNGREITTTHVWEEGDDMKFFIAQGTAGVPKAFVKRIKTTEKSSKQKSDIRHEEGHGQSSHEKNDGGDIRRQEGASHAYREKKLALTSNLDDARNKYLEATAAKNPDAQQGALEEMREVSKRIYALADEVKEKHGGVLPAWWNE
jgi:hypothetical protein